MEAAPYRRYYSTVTVTSAGNLVIFALAIWTALSLGTLLLTAFALKIPFVSAEPAE
jgi:hypothetical protein